MTDELRFENSAQLGNWLEMQPVEWSYAIAARSALRMLPLIAEDIDIKKWEDYGKPLILTVFHCILLAIGGAASRKFSGTANDALPYLSSLDAAVSPLPGREVGITYAHSVAESAAAAATSSVFSASAISAVTAFTGDIVWKSANADADWLVNHGGAHAAKALMTERLWLIDGGTPKWARSNFRKLRADSEIAKQWGFKPWLDWYAALVPLDGRRKPRDIFGADLTRRITTQPKEWWDRGAEAVNADIAAWLAEKEEAEKEPQPPTPPELPPEEPTAHIFRVEESRVVARAVVADPSDPLGAQVYLDELREKADALATALTHQGNMFDGWVTDALVKLRDCLWDGTAPRGLKTLNPHILRARLRPVREIRDGYQPTAEAIAIYPEFMPRIREVAGAGDDLEHCLPELRRIEAERIARALAERNVDENAAREHLDAIIDVTRAVDPGVIDVSVPEALTAEAALADELTSEQEHRFRFATALLATRNFCGKLIGWVRDGCVEGVKFVGKGVTVGGIIVLLRGIAEHVAGLTNIPGFDKIAAALKPLFDLLS